MSPRRPPHAAFMTEPLSHWKRPRGGVRLTSERYLKKCEEIIMRPLRISRKFFNDNWKKLLDSLRDLIDARLEDGENYIVAVV